MNKVEEARVAEVAAWRASMVARAASKAAADASKVAEDISEVAEAAALIAIYTREAAEKAETAWKTAEANIKEER